MSLQNTAVEREKQLAELSASLEEAKQKELSLLLEKNEVQEENSVLLENYTRLQASVTELQTRVQEQEVKSLQKDQLDHEIQELRKSLAGIITVWTEIEFMFYHMFSNMNKISFLASEKEKVILSTLSSVSVSSSLNHYY